MRGATARRAIGRPARRRSGRRPAGCRSVRRKPMLRDQGIEIGKRRCRREDDEAASARAPPASARKPRMMAIASRPTKPERSTRGAVTTGAECRQIAEPRRQAQRLEALLTIQLMAARRLSRPARGRYGRARSFGDRTRGIMLQATRRRLAPVAVARDPAGGPRQPAAYWARRTPPGLPLIRAFSRP